MTTQAGVGGPGQPAEGSDVNDTDASQWKSSKIMSVDQTSKSNCLISRWSCGGGTWPQDGEKQHAGAESSGTRWPGKSLFGNSSGLKPTP